jgi:hypothetical protein
MALDFENRELLIQCGLRNFQIIKDSMGRVSLVSYVDIHMYITCDMHELLILSRLTYHAICCHLIMSLSS